MLPISQPALLNTKIVTTRYDDVISVANEYHEENNPRTDDYLLDFHGLNFKSFPLMGWC
jgi:hypothetical protein